MRNMNSVSVAAAGATTTTTANTSAGGTIPVDGAGLKPKYIRVATSGVVFVRVRVGATTAVNTDTMVTSGAPLVLAVLGNTHYAVIDNGTAATFNIVPLEDQ